jgi:hypothetical protein
MSVDKLKEALKNRNVIPVVGAGISAGAAGLPNWSQLLEKGLEYVIEHEKDLNVGTDDITALRSLLQAKRLIEGFAVLQDLLGGAPKSVHYDAFLTEQFGTPKVSDPSVLDALRNLGTRVIVTTNYDLLLKNLTVVAGAQIATWQSPRQILSLLRGGRGIIHLHGRYDLPESVILSNTDYSRIVHGPADTTTIAQSLFFSGVLMFIGSSLDGASDPHLGSILKEFERLNGPLLEDVMPHFMLVKGALKATDAVKLRRLGIEPIDYGDSFSKLPTFIDSLTDNEQIVIQADDVRARLHNLRVAETLDEIFQDVKTFINDVVYPRRRIRIAFVKKIEQNGRPVLRAEYLFPPKATRNVFSYPQTLAAWALIEGKIFGYSPDIDMDKCCSFKGLRQLKKFERVKALLLASNQQTDPILGEFLKPDDIVRKTQDETLQLSDLYQHWVGRQPEPHYRQFISVPVPVVDELVGQKEPPEYGVLNIDTQEIDPLLTDQVKPLLKMASDIIALGFEKLQKPVQEGANPVELIKQEKS